MTTYKVTPENESIIRALGYPLSYDMLIVARAWLDTIPADVAVRYISLGVQNVFNARHLYAAGIDPDMLEASGMADAFDNAECDIEDIQSFFINML